MKIIAIFDKCPEYKEFAHTDRGDSLAPSPFKHRNEIMATPLLSHEISSIFVVFHRQNKGLSAAPLEIRFGCGHFTRSSGGRRADAGDYSKHEKTALENV